MKDIFSAKIIINKSGRGKVRFSEEETLSLSKPEMFKVFPGDEVMCVRLSGGKAKISKILKIKIMLNKINLYYNDTKFVIKI